jgi:hypothetical protein
MKIRAEVDGQNVVSTVPASQRETLLDVFVILGKSEGDFNSYMQGAGVAQSWCQLGCRLDDQKTKIGFLVRPEFFLFANAFRLDLEDSCGSLFGDKGTGA